MNDEKLIAEAYTKIYHESDKEFAMDNLAGAASDHEQHEADQAEVNQEAEGLKKYTYEILYKTDYKYDPKTKKAISWSYAPHSFHPDIRHQFAYSEEDFWSEIGNSGLGGSHNDELKKSIVIKKVEPADLREVEHERNKGKAISDYYANASRTGAYSGD